jgi:hypothetical protein
MSSTKPPVRDLHASALALHKALLDVVRVGYEKEHGTVASPHALLDLVLSHEAFAWLRHLSKLIIEIDELEETPDANETDLAAARAAFEDLLLRSGESFQVPYDAALHASPEVAHAHAVLRRALAALPAPKEDELAELRERRTRWGAPRKR